MADADILSAWQAATSLAQNVSNNMDSLLREDAQAKLQNMQLAYDGDSAKFLQSLQDSNDYENWQGKTDSFLQSYSDRLQKESGNAYTAKMAKAMMEQNRAGLMVRVLGAAHDGMQKNIRLTDQQSMERIAQQYAGQERVDRQNAILDREYANGTIDRAGYQSGIEQNAVTAQYDMLYDAGSKAAVQAVAAGKSIDTVHAALSSAGKTLSIRMLDDGSARPDVYGTGNEAYSDVTGTIDRDKQTEIALKAKQASEQIYKTTLEKMQNTNSGELSNVLSQMYKVPEGEQREMIRAQGRNIMSMRKKQNSLAYSEGDNNSYSSLFAPRKEKGPGAGTDKFETDMNKIVENYVQAARLGQNSGQPGAETLYGARDVLMSSFNDMAAQYGLTADQTAQEKDKYFNKIVDRAQEVYSNDTHIAPVLAHLKDYAKSISGNKKNEELWNRTLDYTLDLVYDQDVSNMKPEEVEKNVEKFIQTQCSAELDIMAMDRQGKSKFTNKKGFLGIGMESNDELLARGMSELQNNRTAYTNPLDQTVLSKGTELAVSRLDKEAGRAINSVAGIDTGRLTADWKAQDGKHDITGTRVYTDTDTGDKYEIRASNGKHYDVLRNGEKIGSDRDVTGKVQAAEKEQRGKIQEAQKQAQKESEAAQQKLSDEARRMASGSSSPVPEISDEDWQSMDQETRIQQLILYRKI